MPQLRISGPLGELDLRDQRRLHPVRAFIRARPRAERGFLDFERLQQPHHPRELALVETRARVPDVRQVAVFVNAEQQRAEILARLARLGPAADDEFLLVYDLQLAPVRRPLARLVERRRVLGDESFPALIEGALVQRAPVAVYHFTDAEQRRARVTERPLECRAAFEQRPVSKVLLSVAQYVERDERDPRWQGVTGSRAGCRRLSPYQVNAALKLLKSCRLAVHVERDDLAIQDDRRSSLRCPSSERSGDLGKLIGLVVAETRPETYQGPGLRALRGAPSLGGGGTRGASSHGGRAPRRAQPADFRNCANAVVFGLVDELGVLERCVGKRREHRGERRAQPGTLGVPPLHHGWLAQA